MKVLLVFLFLCTSVSFIDAKAPIKFGKFSEELLSMTVCEQDTSASALILCDYGEFDPNDFEFTRTLRIKILKKDGISWANWSFPTKEKGLIQGKTFNLVNGEVEEVKLNKKEDVYREWITGKYYRLRVSMPNVKVGSVIDIQYTEPGLPSAWYFQYTIPVKHSELVIYDNQYVDYTKNFFGFEKLDVNDSHRWVMNDVPAFKKEKYMNNYRNYLSKFEIQISQIIVPERNININYSTSWNAIKTLLYETPNFGGKLEGNNFIKSIAKDIKAMNLSEMQEIKEAIKIIKQVKWDGKNRLFCTSHPLHNRYEKKIANSAELNIMLIELLKDLGFNSEPVVLSTRDNGILSMIYPSLDKLNYVLVHVTVNEKQYLLDATDKYLDPLLIPTRCLNYYGRFIGKDVNEWIDIKAPGKNNKCLVYTLEMDSTGQIAGNLTIKNSEYAARNKRKKYYSFSSEEDFIIDFEKRNASFSVNNFELSGLDDTSEPIVESYDIKIDTRGDMIGSKILLNPMFEEQIIDNPFKLENRLFPIDFNYPIEKTLIVSLKLPNNAKVEELPKPTRIIMPDKSISIVYSIVQMGSTVQVMYKLKINKSILAEDKYSYIKQLYAALIEKHSENIMINLDDQSVAEN